jgi:hypothetical protein
VGGPDVCGFWCGTVAACHEAILAEPSEGVAMLNSSAENPSEGYRTDEFLNVRVSGVLMQNLSSQSPAWSAHVHRFGRIAGWA